jgi:Na+-transporting methylmalonyl-CoA/oxaloacetate decarboxylase gamma subunit
MDKWQFGMTMMVVGVGGTFLTLAIIIAAIELLKRLLPSTATDNREGRQS